MKTGPAILFGLSAVLTAQAQDRHAILLKNWPAPLYWQPSESTELNTSLAHVAPSTTSPLVFVAMTPCRVVDTRASQMFPAPFGPPSLMPGPARTFPIQSSGCSIPSSAMAYSFNVTLVPPGPVGFLTLWPNGVGVPNAVTLDDITGDIRNNAAILPAGTPNGSINAVVNANTDLVIDINGYYVPLNLADFGNFNTAIGFDALINNTSGTQNTASGYLALVSNTNGSSNTASGVSALYSNTLGSQNTAIGQQALLSNTTGHENTATGYQALFSSGTGWDNTANGTWALFNSTGKENTASGAYALTSNTTGNQNTAVGLSALVNSTTGSVNTALGYYAGSSITTGSFNIDIGTSGMAADDRAIRIGSPGVQTSFFAAGIYGVSLSGGVNVMIDGNGQFGAVPSSRRYKEDVQDMADASSGLMRLRPVAFRYKKPYPDGSKPIDYGLIAEEVAEVYPDLVVKNNDGEVETVQYHKLIPMLLNELQKLRAEMMELKKASEHATPTQ